MKIKYGNREIQCDSCTETDGKLSLYQGGVMIMQIANIPDIEKYETEEGEIEHIPSPLEKALQDVASLQTMLHEEAEALAEKVQELANVSAALSDREERLNAIKTALENIGAIPTLSSLTTFLTAVKAAIGEYYGTNQL